jgi:hypothetical protein
MSVLESSRSLMRRTEPFFTCSRSSSSRAAFRPFEICVPPRNALDHGVEIEASEVNSFPLKNRSIGRTSSPRVPGGSIM